MKIKLDFLKIRIESLEIFLFILLISLILKDAGSNLSIYIYLALFYINLIVLLIQSPKLDLISTSNLKVILLIVLIFIIGYIRSYFNGQTKILDTINSIMLLSSVYLYASYFGKNFFFLERFKEAIVLYLLINVVFIFIGIEGGKIFLLGDMNSKLEYSRLGEFLGLKIKRQLLYFTPNFLFISGLASVSIILELKNGILKNSIIRLFIPIIILIITDSRAALIALVIVLLVKSIGFLWRYRKGSFLMILLAFMIFLVFNNNYQNPYSMLSGRDLIWNMFLKNYEPDILRFLFGYGFNGHITSGLSETYAQQIFAHWQNTHHTLHNSLLQSLTDFGFIYIILYFALIYNITSDSKSVNYFQTFGIILFYFILSFVEMVFLPSNLISLFVLFSLIFADKVTREQYKKVI